MAAADETCAVSLSIGTGITEAPIGIQPGPVPAGWNASGAKRRETALELNCLFYPGHICSDTVPKVFLKNTIRAGRKFQGLYGMGAASGFSGRKSS
jgi:hypothetical protein